MQVKSKIDKICIFYCQIQSHTCDPQIYKFIFFLTFSIYLLQLFNVIIIFPYVSYSFFHLKQVQYVTIII